MDSSLAFRREPPPIPLHETPLPVHRVRRGDTLFSLAKTYDTTVEQLLRLNREVSVHDLPVGYELRLPGGKPPVRAVQNVLPAKLPTVRKE